MKLINCLFSDLFACLQPTFGEGFSSLERGRFVIAVTLFYYILQIHKRQYFPSQFMLIQAYTRNSNPNLSTSDLLKGPKLILDMLHNSEASTPEFLNTQAQKNVNCSGFFNNQY